MKRILVVPLLLAVAASPSLAIASAPTVTYIYTDGQGSPVAEADTAGNITATYDYTPYGSTLLGTQKNAPGYTGHVSDPDTSLTYMQARYYDPSMGQFLSVDPLSPSPGQVASFSAYAYAGNNPTTRTDPDGKAWVDLDEKKNADFSGSKIHFVQSNDSGGGQTEGGGQDGAARGAQNQSQQTAQSSSDRPVPYKENIPQATGRLEQVLQCMANRCPGDFAAVTSTHEALPPNPRTGETPHGPETVHGRGEAADLRVPRGQEAATLRCAASCGAQYGQDERAHPSRNSTGAHVHIQSTPGIHGGRGDLPAPDEQR